MKTGHKHLDYKSKVDNQHDVTKCIIKFTVINALLLIPLIVFALEGKRYVSLPIYLFVILFFFVILFLWIFYGSIKVKNLRHQRNVAQGILLAKEFEKEEEDIEE